MQMFLPLRVLEAAAMQVRAKICSSFLASANSLLKDIQLIPLLKAKDLLMRVWLKRQVP